MPKTPLTNAGMHDRAIGEALKAVELDESHFAPHFILGEAYLAEIMNLRESD